jgi:sortase A
VRTSLLPCGLVLALAACGQAASPAAGNPAGSAAVVVTAAPTRHLPVRLQIPAIHVDAAVESVGVTRDGGQSALLMAAPSKPEEAGWYSPGAAPGDGGDVVLDGHLDWKTGPAVFWRLRDLRAQDRITLTTDDGLSFAYAVTDAREWAWDDHPAGLFSTDGAQTLSLITCTGRWDGHRYARRLVVTAAPVA